MSATILLILRVALVAVLYLFLAWALFTLWLDLRRQSKLLGVPQAPPITLSRQVGEELKSFRYTHPEITIGRDPASDCFLEDKTISAQHARMSFHHGQWWIEDLKSTNGTFLNQEAVVEPLVLTAGDLLRCGQVQFQVSLGENGAQNEEKVL
jgi:hypothetical protein